MLLMTLLTVVAMLPACSDSDPAPVPEPTPAPVPGPEPEPDPVVGEPFTLTVKNITPTNFDLQVVVNDENVGNYYVCLMAQWEFDEEFKGDAEVAADAYLLSETEIGTDFTAVDNMYIFRGSTTVEKMGYLWFGVFGDSDFVLLAVGVDARGQKTTKAVTATARTLPMPAANLMVSVADITETSATVNATTADDTRYYLGLFPQWKVEELSDDNELFSWLMPTDFYGDNMFYSGTKKLLTGENTLESGTEYCVIAFEIDEYNYPTSAVVRTLFTTEGEPRVVADIVIPDVKFGEVEVYDITATNARIKVTPNDLSMRYIIMSEPKEYVDKFKTDEELLQDDRDMWWWIFETQGTGLSFFEIVENSTNMGAKDVYLRLENYPMKPDSDMVAWVYGISLDDCSILTEVVKIPFHTQPANGTTAAAKQTTFGRRTNCVELTPAQQPAHRAEASAPRTWRRR